MAGTKQKEMSLIVSEIRQETPEIKSFRLELGAHRPFLFIPGQFVILSSEFWNPKRNRMGRVNRAFSISSSPVEEGYIEIAAKRYPGGQMTPWLHDHVSTGDALRVKGPAGKFVFREGESGEILLIAGGIGIAPFRCMIRYILAKGLRVKVRLFYSARTPGDFAFASEFKSLMAGHPNFECVYSITRPGHSSWSGPVGRFDEAFLRDHLGGPDALYYLCGPDAMIGEHSRILKDLGVPEAALRSEKW